ncbi:MAG: PQQ-binding-like beta-propeller repeat protein, partial [Gammaproteobacteria bacterium]|nr:PQQ-binding-like beta-propeller repeat protein [Gammaproteobacteria bacterium]
QNSFVRWRRDISTRLPMAVDAGQIFVTGSLGNIVALDADSGGVLWRQNAFRGHGMTNPLVFDSRVVVGDASGFVHLLDRADGTLLQSLKLDRSAITGLARQGESVVAVSVDGTVVSVGFTGS